MSSASGRQLSRNGNNGKTRPARANGVHRRDAAPTAAKNQPAKCLLAGNHARPSWFTMFAQRTSYLAGRPVTFMLAVAVIVIWAVTGPLFDYSDTWQLVINTGTTIVTFLMVFLIQHTQNRDALAIQVKLDELIIKLHGAGNELAAAEDLCDEDLEALHEEYRRRAALTQNTLDKRHSRVRNNS